MTKLALVKDDSFGVTVLDGIPVVSSRKVAEIFDKRHDVVLRAVETCECSKEFRNRNFVVSYYRAGKGKYKEYLLTKDGFVFVVMGFTGKKAAQFKEAYINRFNEMERFIINRNLARLEYPELTNAIKIMHENPRYYHYSNEADMLNQIVLGMRARDFRKEHGLAKGESVREHLTPWQMEAIQRLQKFDVGLVVTIPDYQERKEILKTYFEKIRGYIEPENTMLLDEAAEG